ncbi:hypothetical protein [Streptomyces sp. XD-27]|uniref:hypothetical protein n=1 Tax=Streptomyces sp. XD-27 TaxID=3062779 RepID=UPI0026F426CE|nr:hypothetical protein [Streptomyces sp. XD-27]WKX74418.1 hypothetical protein Q3Y56_23290 [Streptomyces sp. XD-27]
MCVGLTATLAGCGGEKKDPDAGTNGVGKLPATKIEAKARSAANGAEAVHLSGTLVTKGQSYKLDMRLKGDGGTGQVSTKDGTFELLRVGKDLYLKAGADFWSRQEGSRTDQAAADKLGDRYVKVPVGDPSYKQLGGFTDKGVLLDGLLALHGELATGDRGELGGVRTIRILGAEGSGGSLDVSLEGTPYPLRLQRAGGAGVIQLTDWNKDFALAAPDKDDIVDYGRQLPSRA